MSANDEYYRYLGLILRIFQKDVTSRCLSHFFFTGKAEVHLLTCPTNTNITDSFESTQAKDFLKLFFFKSSPGNANVWIIPR
jgi:hypothetical protein